MWLRTMPTLEIKLYMLLLATPLELHKLFYLLVTNWEFELYVLIFKAQPLVYGYNILIKFLLLINQS